MELLTRAFLLWFIIYTLSICPDDAKLKSPICRGLSEYRRLVVDPYIAPPLQWALEHPSVAPYVERAKPYADHAIRTATPIMLRTQQEWNTRVVPQFHKHVVPLWERYAVPQIRRADAQIAPYRTQLEQIYESRLGPHVRATTRAMNRLHNQVQPYVILAAQKTHAGYVYAKPYARPVWEKFVDILIQLITVIGEQRRKFVDPHVHKIWERVKELASGKSTVTTAADVQETARSRVAHSASSVASSITSASPLENDQVHVKPNNLAEAVSKSDIKSTITETVASVTSSSAIPSKAFSSISAQVVDASSHLQDSAASVSTAASASGPSLSSPGSSLYEKSSSSISSVASVPATSTDVSASSPSSIVPSVTQELASTVSDAVSVASGSSASAENQASIHKAVSDVGSSATAVLSSLLHSSVSSSEAAATPSISVSVGVAEFSSSAAISSDPDQGHVGETDLDLEAFYAELGLEEDFVPETVATPTSAPVPTQTRRAETEEEREERLRLRAIENQKKRVELDGRRDKWETELAQKIETSKKALRKALVALRKSATAELKENQEIHDELKDLEAESEKLLKGAEKYLQTMQKEGKTSDDKKMLWDRVVDKVEAKFVEKLGQAESVVNGWYLKVLNKELDEVRGDAP